MRNIKLTESEYKYLYKLVYNEETKDLANYKKWKLQLSVQGKIFMAEKEKS